MKEHQHKSNSHRDDTGARLGMWLFLFTEVMLFGALFIIYAVYRYQYLPEFTESSAQLSLAFGAVNTVILIASSLTMVFSIAAVQRNNEFISSMWVMATLALALVFLGNKFLEWLHKFESGIYPNSPELLAHGRGETIFYGLYFLMTGLHALHIAAGVALLGYVGYLLNTGEVKLEKHVLLVNTGLYWHLVDIIWIFLFPLFYLIG